MSKGRTSREQDYSLPTCHRAVLLTMHPSLRFQLEIRAIEGGVRASGAGVKGVYSVWRYTVCTVLVYCTRCIDVVMQRLYEAQVSQAERVLVCADGYMDTWMASFDSAMISCGGKAPLLFLVPYLRRASAV